MGSPASSMLEASEVNQTAESIQSTVPSGNVSVTITLSQAQFARLVQSSQGGVVFNVEDGDLTRLGLIQSQGGETNLFIPSAAGRYVLDQIQAGQTTGSQPTRH